MEATIQVSLPTTPPEMAPLPITWELIDHATDTYAKTLHQYNMAEMIKGLLKKTARSSHYAILPTPGNLDLNDAFIGFHDFLLARDAVKGRPKEF
jgi:hypothetical protein